MAAQGPDTPDASTPPPLCAAAAPLLQGGITPDAAAAAARRVAGLAGVRAAWLAWRDTWRGAGPLAPDTWAAVEAVTARLAGPACLPGDSEAVEIRVFPVLEPGDPAWLVVGLAAPAAPATDAELTGLAAVVADAVALAARHERQAATDDHLAWAMRRLTMATLDQERVARAVAHDLREPARAVSLHAQLLVRMVGGDVSPEVRGTLDHVVSEGHDLRQRLDAFLTYLEAGDMLSRPRPVALSDSLEAARQRLAAPSGAPPLRLVHNGLPTVYGDPERLTELFRHLLHHALAHARRETPCTVTVTLADEGRPGTVEFAYAGLPPLVRNDEDAFDILVRLPGGEERGLAWDLPMVRRIVEAHEGRIWLQAIDGPRVRFHLWLPVTEDPA